jgi:hypothetical protein
MKGYQAKPIGNFTPHLQNTQPIADFPLNYIFAQKEIKGVLIIGIHSNYQLGSFLLSAKRTASKKLQLKQLKQRHPCRLKHKE